MGLYNVLNDTQVCYSCGNTVNLAIQFSYGEVWLHTYKMGDQIIWGKGNVGNPNEKKVVVSSFSEDCPVCGAARVPYEVTIENGKLISAEPPSGKYDFDTGDEYYVVVSQA